MAVLVGQYVSPSGKMPIYIRCSGGRGIGVQMELNLPMITGLPSMKMLKSIL